jgi:hypothetical protein
MSGRNSKERLAESVTGEKLPPFMIGKANQRKCLKNVNMNSFPVNWRTNKVL